MAPLLSASHLHAADAVNILNLSTGGSKDCNALGGSLDLRRVWTALQRGVHTSDFMFEALRDSRQPKENMHDVYCSGCGTLTACRSRNNAEGGAPNITLAGVSV